MKLLNLVLVIFDKSGLVLVGEIIEERLWGGFEMKECEVGFEWWVKVCKRKVVFFNCL